MPLINDCLKLGFGLMRLPKVEDTQTIDVEQTKQMVDAFIQAGGRYFDTACKSEKEAKNEIMVSLERTGAQYFDFYLLHALDSGNQEKYVRYGLWDYVKQLKAEGLIRHYGFSFHDGPALLDQLLTDHPDAEFVQLQINYSDWEAPSSPRASATRWPSAHHLPARGGGRYPRKVTVPEILRKITLCNRQSHHRSIS